MQAVTNPGESRDRGERRHRFSSVVNLVTVPPEVEGLTSQLVDHPLFHQSTGALPQLPERSRRAA
jgi:hypothetical protein